MASSLHLYHHAPADRVDWQDAEKGFWSMRMNSFPLRKQPIVRDRFINRLTWIRLLGATIVAPTFSASCSRSCAKKRLGEAQLGGLCPETTALPILNSTSVGFRA
jgi:hypothetical protein